MTYETLKTEETSTSFNLATESLLRGSIITIAQTPNANIVLAYPPMRLSTLSAILNPKGYTVSDIQDKELTIVRPNGNNSNVMGTQAIIKIIK